MLLLAASTGAGETNSIATARPAVVKPAWLTDLSAGVRETYDNNVMMVVQKSGSMPLQPSWITTFSPRVGFNFAPLFGKPDALDTFTLAYQPDFFIYHNLSSENHNTHTFTNSLHGRLGKFSYAITQGFMFVDASSIAPAYQLPGGAAKQDYNVLAMISARDRRKQVQERPSVSLRYDQDHYFLRASGSLVYFDMLTDWRDGGVGNNTLPRDYGYLNYVDRADVNGGPDLGWKITPDFALTLGYRYGHQYQQSLPPSINVLAVNGRPANATSDYQRLLFGLEGKPLHGLTLNAVIGPDFRDYNSAAPVPRDRLTTFFTQSSLTLNLATNQSLSLSYKRWYWEASIGRLTDIETTAQIAYHADPIPALGLDLAFKFINYDYTINSAALTTLGTTVYSYRNDDMYSLSAGLTWRFNPHFSATAGYTVNLGRNQQPQVANAFYRTFDQQLVSLALNYKF